MILYTSSSHAEIRSPVRLMSRIGVVFAVSYWLKVVLVRSLNAPNRPSGLTVICGILLTLLV